jgi:hypothetical protein
MALPFEPGAAQVVKRLLGHFVVAALGSPWVTGPKQATGLPRAASGGPLYGWVPRSALAYSKRE